MTEIDSKYASGTLAESMGADEMPREKLMNDGAYSLTNVELLAILLRTGVKGMNVLQLSQFIYDTYGKSLTRMADRTVKEFCADVSGVGLGPAKAVTLLAALELGRRRLEETVSRIQLNSADRACNYFRSRFSNSTVEEFHVAVLDHRLNVVYEAKVAEGGLASVALDIRRIFKAIIGHDGAGFMVAHNHPAGSAKPSKQDIELTNRLLEGARVLGLNFIDHIIVPQGHVGEQYFSFKDDGLLD